MRLLVAEDDPRLLKSLVHIFETNKYSVDGVSNGNDAYDYAASDEYDGLIFDIMMPGKDGIEVLKELRRRGISTPAMFLTAKTEVSQRVEGLDAGADDYLPKPFASTELLARVRAMLRRKDNFVPDILNYKDLKLDKSTYQLYYGNESVSLSGKEFQIMDMLMNQPEIIVTSEQIITHIWGWNADIDISVIWVHVSNLRKKIVSLGAPVEIRFIRNAGYILGENK